MSSAKKQLQTSMKPEKDKSLKNRATIKTFPAFIFLLIISSICFFRSTLFPYFSDPTYHSLETTPFQPAPICHQGFSVYVYDLPPKFNLDLLRNCKHLNVYTDMCPHVANNGLGQPLGGATSATWFATHQFIAEMIFHARVENHPCRMWEPETADLFYVPFYGGLYASSVFREFNHTKRDELAVGLENYLGTQHWFERNNGRDHFLALGRTAWDFMRTGDGYDFGANILLNLPRVRNMSVLTVERQPWKGSNQFGIPYSSYFHPSTLADMMTWQEKMKRTKRDNLYSFVGGSRKGVEKASIRDELIRQCAESSRCELLKCNAVGSR